jgi:N,N'-diacetyllegionaminate synthase
MAPNPAAGRPRSVEIIAEAANGHEGDRQRLLLLTSLAVAAGADAVKFQLVYGDEIFTRDHPLYQQFTGQELPDDAWAEAASVAQEAGTAFYLDVFGPRSARLADQIGADGVKLHATDIANHALVRTVAQLNVPRVLLGTGGAFREEIASALELLDVKDIVLLHGFQVYPTVNSDNQVLRLVTLRSEFPSTTVGFADHVPPEDPATIWLSALAIGAGARAIEKHLTFARVLKAVDHEAALAPDDFAAFVRNMRTAEETAAAPDMSPSDYGMSSAERGYRERVRKSLVAARDLRAGDTLTVDDLVLKRSPQPEAMPEDPEQVVGRCLRVGVREGDPIHAGVLDGG